ncbi:hypothetical protein GSF08_07640 [Clostridiaceae bacterium DONG20-135]|uniref:Uncharacterized protein n=1 Tax=Copranaerobaculum intestinale TaxID=2692629 RepID=A0A6N8U7J7_9FIRM|nr:hypothetical protein [Copranaerobaculum intestinale]MXQ73810.1 hypothetical protein [Copranaerobaculum intestinale]
MKAMKKSISIIAVVFMISGVCLVSGYMVCQSMLTKGLMKIAFQDVTLTSIFDRQFTFDAKTEEQFQKIKNKITEDEQLQQIVHDYSVNILSALADGQGTVPDLDHDIKKILEKHETEVKELLPADIPLADQESFVDFLLKDIDLQPLYDQAIQTGREQLSPSVLKLMELVSWFASDTVQSLGLVMVGVGIILLVIFSWERMKWMRSSAIALSISGIGIYCVSLLIKLFKAPSDAMIGRITNVYFEVAAPQLNQYTLWMLSGAVLLFAGYFLLQKLIFDK